MNRMVSLARIMFAGIGIHLGISALGSIIQPVIMIVDDPSTEILIQCVGIMIVSAAMLALIVWGLFIKGEYWANKLIVNNIDSDKPLNIELTLAMAFRLVCVGAGLLCLGSFITSTGRLFLRIHMYMQQTNANWLDIRTYINYFGNMPLLECLQLMFLLALAVYLLFGAPHFVNWQVKKTKKLCNEN